MPAGMIATLEAVAGTDAEVPTGIELAAGVLQAVRPLCAGVHLMAMGWEAHLRAILEHAGIGGR